MNSDYVCSLSEYVGTAAACTIGMVIATVDQGIKELLDIPAACDAIGIVSSRTGTVAQALAIDDAVKECSARLLRFEMSIDGGRQCGQGCLFVLGADTITDARRVVEISLDRTDYWMGCLYLNHVGHMEGHVTAHAGEVLHEIFGTPLGKAFGIIGAAPAGIGIVAVDQAMKAAPVAMIRIAKIRMRERMRRRPRRPPVPCPFSARTPGKRRTRRKNQRINGGYIWRLKDFLKN